MTTPARYYKLRNDSPDRLIVWWLIKVVEEDDAVFDAYVGLDRHGRVVERSSSYGVFEGSAEGFQEDSGASVVDEKEFTDASGCGSLCGDASAANMRSAYPGHTSLTQFSIA